MKRKCDIDQIHRKCEKKLCRKLLIQINILLHLPKQDTKNGERG